MSSTIHVQCDGCGKAFAHQSGKTTPFVVSLAQPGSYDYRYGTTNGEPWDGFSLQDCCEPCRKKLLAALDLALEQLK